MIVRNATLESLYPGGVSGYAADCPNRTFCSDGVLTRVGFMTPDDVGAFLERLETRGLVFLHDGVAADTVESSNTSSVRCSSRLPSSGSSSSFGSCS